MRRYPKHARPLWGAAKRRRAICGHGLTGPTGVSLTFNYAVGPTPPRPGVLTFTADGTTPGEAVAAINAPVEVRQ